MVFALRDAKNSSRNGKPLDFSLGKEKSSKRNQLENRDRSEFHLDF